MKLDAQSFNLFLTAGMAVCAAMAVFNIVRSRSRGTSSLWLATGFIIFGVIFYLIKNQFSTALELVLGFFLLVCLVMDMFLRMSKAEIRSKK